MPSEAVKQRMDANVLKKGNLEFLVCKEVANPGVNELVDKGRPLKRKRFFVYVLDRQVMQLVFVILCPREELSNELTNQEELAVLQVEVVDMEGRMQELMEELKKSQK
ncbi:hypothetical protein Tco_0517455 [Tanacetum coccineum]